MVTRALGLVGAVGSLGASLANLGCCGIGIVAPAAFAGAASAFGSLGAAWGYEVMYASLGLMLMSLVVSAWRHRRPGPVLLGLGGAAALLLAFHDAWDVRLFGGLVVAGGLGLGIAVASDIRFAVMTCRRPAAS